MHYDSTAPKPLSPYGAELCYMLFLRINLMCAVSIRFCEKLSTASLEFMCKLSSTLRLTWFSHGISYISFYRNYTYF